jgi:beta-1,2-mannobiose phosphorylase / 1,2-beta-oligomannan phosphorylase
MKLHKYEGNPILKPNENNDWESLCVLNPAAVYEDGEVKLLYRAAGNDFEHRIYLGLATSKDGFHFDRVSDKPVMSPDIDHSEGGCEDPRVVKMGDYYFVTYAARPHQPGQYWLYDGPQATPKFGEYPEFGPRCLLRNSTISYLAISKDLKSFVKIGRLTDSRYEDRDVIIFPEQMNGKYAMFSRPEEWKGEGFGCDTPSIWISFSEDLLEWPKPTLFAKGEQWWESKKIGGSTPPIKTNKGWLFLYHGVSAKDDKYRVGAMLLDLNDPTVILARTKDYIMEPEFDYETSGYYSGCVFPTGNIVIDGVLYVYYGAADKYCCAATCQLNELLDYLCNECSATSNS